MAAQFVSYPLYSVKACLQSGYPHKGATATDCVRCPPVPAWFDNTADDDDDDDDNVDDDDEDDDNNDDDDDDLYSSCRSRSRTWCCCGPPNSLLAALTSAARPQGDRGGAGVDRAVPGSGNQRSQGHPGEMTALSLCPLPAATFLLSHDQFGCDKEGCCLQAVAVTYTVYEKTKEFLCIP